MRGQGSNAFGAALDPAEPCAQFVGQCRQIVWLDAVLAGQRAQIEQPGFIGFQPCRIEGQRLGGGIDVILRLCAFDDRPVDRRQRLVQGRMIARHPFQDARRLPQPRQPAIRSIEQVGDRLQVASDLLAALHGRAAIGEFGFFARFGVKRRQFGDGVLDPFAVAIRVVLCAPGGGKRGFGIAPFLPGGSDRHAVDAGEGVQQGAVPPRVEQAAIVMLAVDFHQRRAQFSKQRGGRRLIVDKAAAAAVAFDDPPNDQRFAAFDLEAIIREQRQRGASFGWIEARRHHRLRRAGAHQRAIAARAEREPQRIEQDRFARPRLSGQHAEAAVEIQIERLDQHDIADGKGGQHRAPDPR